MNSAWETTISIAFKALSILKLPILQNFLNINAALMPVCAKMKLQIKVGVAQVHTAINYLPDKYVLLLSQCAEFKIKSFLIKQETKWILIWECHLRVFVYSTFEHLAVFLLLVPTTLNHQISTFLISNLTILTLNRSLNRHCQK